MSDKLTNQEWLARERRASIIRVLVLLMKRARKNRELYVVRRWRDEQDKR